MDRGSRRWPSPLSVGLCRGLGRYAFICAAAGTWSAESRPHSWVGRHRPMITAGGLMSWVSFSF